MFDEFIRRDDALNVGEAIIKHESAGGYVVMDAASQSGQVIEGVGLYSHYYVCLVVERDGWVDCYHKDWHCEYQVDSTVSDWIGKVQVLYSVQSYGYGVLLSLIRDDWTHTSDLCSVVIVD